MKKVITTLFLGLVALAVIAQSSDDKPVAYYPAPNGVFYLGVDMNGNQPGADIAVAPADVNLTFKAKLEEGFNGDYAWYPSEEYGTAEIDNADLTLKHSASDNLIEAPTLYVVDGRGYSTFKMAQGGIAYGYGFLQDSKGNEYYAANYNQNELNGLFYDGTIFLNWDDATTALNDKFKSEGSNYSNINVRGYGEFFSYAKDYLLRAIHVGVVTDEELTKSDVIAKIFAADANGNVIGNEPLAIYKADSLKLHETSPNFYEIHLISDASLKVTSPIMVVFTTAEGCMKKIGPEELLSQSNHIGERVTSYLMADYKFGNTQHTGSFMQWTKETQSYGRTYYQKHWNVSIKQDYNVGTDITYIKTPRKATSLFNKGIYTINGTMVSEKYHINDLPKGIYIINGKKIIKK